MIRAENKNDIEKIYYLVKTVFKRAEYSDGKEHELVNALRNSTAFIPQLSLVAEIDDVIVGHILFSKIKIGDSIELALAPLSVLPEYQRQGIGTALMKEGHKIARELGYNYSIVLGSEKYYPKVGYTSAKKFGILPPFDVPSDNFMVLPLCDENIKVSGIVEYAKEFGL